MPIFDIESEDGRKISLEGDVAPSPDEIDEIFAGIPKKQDAMSMPSMELKPQFGPMGVERLPIPPGTPKTFQSAPNVQERPAAIFDPEAIARQEQESEAMRYAALTPSPEDYPSGSEITEKTGIPRAVTVPWSSAAKVGLGLGQFLTSPAGASETAVAATPAAPIVTLKWAWDMLKSAKDSLGDLFVKMPAEAFNQYVADRMRRNIQGSPLPEEYKQDFAQRGADDVINALVLGLGGTKAAKEGVKGIAAAPQQYRARAESLGLEGEMRDVLRNTENQPLSDVDTAANIRLGTQSAPIGNQRIGVRMPEDIVNPLAEKEVAPIVQQAFDEAKARGAENPARPMAGGVSVPPIFSAAERLKRERQQREYNPPLIIPEARVQKPVEGGKLGRQAPTEVQNAAALLEDMANRKPETVAETGEPQGPPRPEQPLRTMAEIIEDRLKKRDFVAAVDVLSKQPAEVQRKVLDNTIGVNRATVGLSAAEQTIFNELWDKVYQDSLKKGAKNATVQPEVERLRQQERPGTDELGKTAETSGRNRPVESGQGAKEAQGPVSFFDRQSEMEGLGRMSTAPTLEDIRAQRAAEAKQNKPEVAKLDTNVDKNKFGDPRGTTYHATPEDWAAWQEVQKHPVMESFAERERIKNKYGGMPPEPPKEVSPSPIKGTAWEPGSPYNDAISAELLKSVQRGTITMKDYIALKDGTMEWPTDKLGSIENYREWALKNAGVPIRKKLTSPEVSTTGRGAEQSAPASSAQPRQGTSSQPSSLLAGEQTKAAETPAAETIKSTAIRLPDGTIYTGKTPGDIHGKIIALLESDPKYSNSNFAIGEKDLGFLTSTGRFVSDRKEAARIAGLDIQRLGAEHITKSGNISQKNVEFQKAFDALDEARRKKDQPAIDRAIQAIESLQKKIRGSGKLQMGVPSAILDTALEAAKLVLRAGGTIERAIDAAIGRIKEAHNKFNESALRDRLMFELGRKREPWQSDAAYDMGDRYDRELAKLASEFENSKSGAIATWPVVNAAKLKRVWLDFGRSGVVRNEKALDEIAEQILNSIARLNATTDVMGHSMVAPKEVLDRIGYEWGDKKIEKFGDFLSDKHGNWLLSDYGLEPLNKAYNKIFSAATPEQKLYAIDAALNVIHQRSDLSALLVEGGQKTLSEVASQVDLFSKPIQAIENLQKKLQKGFHEGRTSMGVPAAILDTALGAAKLALKAGKSVAEAIEAALAHIRRNIRKGDWNEAKVKAMLEKELSGAVAKPVVPAEAAKPTATKTADVAAPNRTVEETLSKVQKVFEPKPKQKTPVSVKASNVVEAVRTGLSSKFRPVNWLEEMVAKANPSYKPKDIAGIMEQLKGSQGKGEADVYRFDRDVSKLVSGSEKEFSEYVFMRRTLDRLKQDAADINRAIAGEEVPVLNRRSVSDFTINELEPALKAFEKKLGPEKLKKFQEAADQYQRHMDNALRLQVESGRMSPEIYDAIKSGNEFYAPFKVMKYLEESSRPEGSGRKIDTVTDYTKAMKGIEDRDFRLGDMLAAGRQNILMSRILADKNTAMRAVAEIAPYDIEGRFIKKLKPSEEAPSGMAAVNVLEGGKKQRYAVDTKVAEAIQLYGGNAAGVLSRMLGYASIPFRAGATALNLPFQVSNLLADVPRQAFVSKYGLTGAQDFVRFPLDFVHSLYSSITGDVFGKKNKLFLDFLDSGVAGTTIQEYLTPEALKFKEPTAISRSKKLASSVLNVIPDFAKAIEQTSKIMGVKRAMRMEGVESGKQLAKQIPEAITELRRFSGSPDFGRQGKAIEAARLNLIYMFLNARIQGAIADVGRLAGRDGGKQAAVTWLRIASAVGIPTAYLWYLNNKEGNKEDYESRPIQERQNYWLIPKEDENGKPRYITTEEGEKIRDYWRVPKRESSKWIANLTESALQFAKTRNPKSAADFGNQMIQELSPVNLQGDTAQERLESVASSLNPLIKAPLEMATGRDLYRHRPVMSDQLKKASPEQQYTERTPEAFKKLAEAMPDVSPEIIRSPIMLENLTRNLTAGLVTQFLPRKDVQGRSKLENNPLLQRFQSLPMTDNSEFQENVKGLERQAVDEQLNRHRKALEAMEKNPNAQLPNLIASVLPKDKSKITSDDVKLMEHLTDLWVAKQNGATFKDRQVMALPARQRALWVQQQLGGLTPQKKAEKILELARKRIFTESVAAELVNLEQEKEK